MRLKTLAFVAGFCLFGAAAANAAPVDGATAFSAYQSWFLGWSDYLGSVGAVWNTTFSANAGSSGFSSIVAFINVSSIPAPEVPFTELFSWNSGGSVIANAAPVPVPGPEAGAGIGAFALGGVAYLISRRRRRAAVAA